MLQKQNLAFLDFKATQENKFDNLEEEMKQNLTDFHIGLNGTNDTMNSLSNLIQNAD